ncbi:MAG: pseudouridine synthase [Candidatus Bathyarchaeota archaeon]|nr:pseudouridine synthase [Candidatus Bathyarchaeum tardum]WGM90496.1 MAG: pseudouridine synthase [Candidatus Bathyarchaeum tardum]
MDEMALQKIRTVADFQFGKGTGSTLFPDDVQIDYSKNTGKIRYVYLNEELLATLRPTVGMFVLAVAGAKRIVSHVSPLRLWVKLEDFAEPFVADGRSAFAKHVIDADPEIRPNEEVIVISQKGEVLAVGRAVLSGTEMLAFNKGIAVKVRHGTAEKS